MTLADVHPLAPGVPWRVWLVRSIGLQPHVIPADWLPLDERPWYRKGWTTPRDNFGMAGVFGGNKRKDEAA